MNMPQKEYFKVIESECIDESKLFNTEECNYYKNKLIRNRYKSFLPLLEEICKLSRKYEYGLDLYMILYKGIKINKCPYQDLLEIENIPLYILTNNDEYALNENISIDNFKSIIEDINLLERYELNFSIGTYLCEYIFEDERKRNFSDKISRLESYFVFSSIEDCKYYIDRHEIDMPIVKITPKEINNYCECDIKHIDDKKARVTIKEYECIANRYWKGERTNEPVIETFFQGTFKMERI